MTRTSQVFNQIPPYFPILFFLFLFCLSATSLPLLGSWVSSDLCAWLSPSTGSPRDGKGMDGVFGRYGDGSPCHRSRDRQRKYKQQSSRPLLCPWPHQHTRLICPVIITKMSHKHTAAIKGKVPSSRHQEAAESSLGERETQIYLQNISPRGTWGS